jgi:hypothetical protein
MALEPYSDENERRSLRRRGSSEIAGRKFKDERIDRHGEINDVLCIEVPTE